MMIVLYLSCNFDVLMEVCEYFIYLCHHLDWKSQVMLLFGKIKLGHAVDLLIRSSPFFLHFTDPGLGKKVEGIHKYRLVVKK